MGRDSCRFWEKITDNFYSISMKIVLSPKYSALDSFVSGIPDSFEKEGTVIYNQRNILKVFTVGEITFVVKRFRTPIFLNRIAYTYFRSSKARRSFEHASLLQEKGIGTPDPIAYIEEKKNGLLYHSYYICIYENESSHIREQMLGKKGDQTFIKELACFIAKMHNNGVFFLDLSPGNILFHLEEDQLKFSLVDINRMKFRTTIPLNTRFENFKRISEDSGIIHNLAQEYAKACSLNEEETIKGITKSCIDFYNKNHRTNYSQSAL